MKRRIVCASCGRILTGLNFSRVWDENLNKAVPVCADTYACEFKFVKTNQKKMKALEDYRKEHVL
ncbi:MAG: hypothetical protein WCR45_03010 [Bacteroidaceae bacterium]|nr:hypothetical protein [Bacteroidaceae bacterium]